MTKNKSALIREIASSNLTAPLHRARLFFVKSAALQLLESFPDQLLKLLRLRDVSLHLLLSKTGLKRHNLLEILCLGDLFDEREALTRHSSSRFPRHGLGHP